ncbi:unnamed protein product [Mytilus coruscus]|uniref:Mab-21-like HhH/H2TH-like domain-containing protein n=1 Tax=Mytilus coruscus TaxID=42192 RepID=A0A6J8B4Y1_MYTCO|nr:unnamed protein product [Mytilus coruscus]
MSNNDSKDISKIANKVLSLSGISEVMTLLSKCKTEVIEVIHRHRVETIYAGSLAEGTDTKESDFDQMTVIPGITVCISNEKAKHLDGHVFELNAIGSQPGYCRVQLHHLADEECLYFKACQGSIKDLIEEQNDGIFLSSDKFVNVFVNLAKRLGFCMPPQVRHGPCAMSEVNSTLKMYRGWGKGEKDWAHGLVCEEWPVGANEWFRRKRHDWPKTEVQDIIKKQSCHVVPVGDRISSFYSLQWRISFILQERELVWSFNDTQLQCYVLMKKMMKKYVEPTVPDELSSYHLKTILFWQSEEVGISIWKSENLLQCIIDCFQRLLDCIENEALEHYFHRHRNLLANKLKNKANRKFVCTKIKEIMNNVQTCVLECLNDMEDLAAMLTKSGTNETNFLQQCKNLPALNERYLATEEAHNTINMHRFVFEICLSSFKFDEKEIAGMIASDLETLDDKIKLQDTSVMGMLYVAAWSFYNMRVGMIKYRYMKAPTNPDINQEYIVNHPVTIDEAFKHGRVIDQMSGRLYLASVNLTDGNFATSNQIVLSVLKADNILVYPGLCSLHRHIQLTMQGIPKQGPNIRKNKKGKMPHAFDVVFSPNDIYCVPIPVGYECSVTQLNKEQKYNDSILFHPCVYAQFLLCFGYHKIGNQEEFQNVLEQLQSTVEDIVNGYQRYRALNLLGYCYYVNGNYQQAFRCFRESITITNSKMQNAAFTTYVHCLCVYWPKRRNCL